jgi:hypothetical protein
VQSDLIVIVTVMTVALGASMIYVVVVPPVRAFVRGVNAVFAVAISFVAAHHLDRLRQTFEVI